MVVPRWRALAVALAAAKFGNRWQTPDGLWASDHLGHVATLSLR